MLIPILLKDLPNLCRDNKAYQPKIVDVLAQLMQSNDKSEIETIQAAMVKLFHKDPKATLIGLFSQVSIAAAFFILESN